MKVKRDFDVPGFKVGGFHSDKAESGLTFIFTSEENVAGMSQRGQSPGTRETDLLRSGHRKNRSVNGIVLSGRSIFGLKLVDRLVERLYQDGYGIRVGEIRIPIVPAAVIFDFQNNYEMPDDEWADRAFDSLGSKIAIGREWAGRGATVGKFVDGINPTPSGQGFSTIKYGRVFFSVICVVNAYGSVYDTKGKIIAGPKDSNGMYIDPIERGMKNDIGFSPFSNTTIGVLLTNIKASSEEMSILAESVNQAFSRRIIPFNTEFDGDTFFAVSLNTEDFPFYKAFVSVQKVASDAISSIFGD
ncbi:MAG: P1 family peptidase [Nitrososphaerota archaeon]